MKKISSLTKFVIAFAAAVVCIEAFACQGITAKGTRCKRPQEPYCWQHGGQTSSSSSQAQTSGRSYSTRNYSSQPRQTSAGSGSRSFSKAMRMRKYKEQNGICPHCGGYFEFWEMHGDHIIPYSKGGPTTYGNLQMLCVKCNLKKGNRYSY